jgi:hypothetical protein
MSDATTPSGKPWWKKKRLYIPVAVVVVLAAIGSTGTKKDKETPVAVAATTEAQAAATAATTQATIPVPTTAKPLSKSKRRDRDRRAAVGRRVVRLGEEFVELRRGSALAGVGRVRVHLHRDGCVGVAEPFGDILG